MPGMLSPSSQDERVRESRSSWQFSGLAIVGVVAFLAAFTRVGADCYWLVAQGDFILDHGEIPDGLPFAAAPTQGWPNPLVLAQLTMSGLHSISGAALPFAQLLADAVMLALIAWGARNAGASDRATAVVLLALAVGSLASLAIVRLQIFSLVPFAALILLLRSQADRATRHIWFLPALVALWSNLHGAVLLGVCVAGAYLLFSRLRERPAESVLVGVATLFALLVTSAGWRTAPYYVAVMNNEAAERAEGLWARPSLGNPLDVLMILAGAAFVILACRRRLPVWEYVVLAGLTIATVTAARHGVWLLMFAAGPAALGLTRHRTSAIPSGTKQWSRPLLTVAAACLVSLGVLLPRGDQVLPADPELVARTADLAADRVVLAPEPLAESLAVEGMTLWAVNPIDAFEPADQNAFMDFLEGRAGMQRAVEDSDAVVVEDGTDAVDVMSRSPGFTRRPLTDGWTIYLRDAP